jgi:hypothetical protein
MCNSVAVARCAPPESGMSARRVVVIGPTRLRVQHRHLVLDVTGTAALRHDRTQELCATIRRSM